MGKRRFGLNQSRTPCEKRLYSCLNAGGPLITVGLGEHLVELLGSCPSALLTQLSSATDLLSLGDDAHTACIIVGVDVFDSDAMSRLQETCTGIQSWPDAFVIAVTSFMPGAFDEYMRHHGANLCVTEEYISEVVGVVLNHFSEGDI